MEDGQFDMAGTPSELYANAPRFKRLYDLDQGRDDANNDRSIKFASWKMVNSIWPVRRANCTRMHRGLNAFMIWIKGVMMRTMIGRSSS
ncbi:hypothetical protein WP50_39190, partial [Lactiplantibacillus plantarum]